jgi:predicted RNase H-like HicB family nuclease
MESLDFAILETLYQRDRDLRLNEIYSEMLNDHASKGEVKKDRIGRRLHKLSEVGAVEGTHRRTYLITPKGRERFLSELQDREPESPLLNRKKLVVQAQVEALEEGGYLAVCEDIQGCHAEGETVAEALANLEDVARIVLELRRETGLRLPKVLEEYRPDRLLKAQVVVALSE